MQDHASLLAGTRQLRIEAEGYDPYLETLTVAAGMEIRKTIRLRAGHSYLAHAPLRKKPHKP